MRVDGVVTSALGLGLLLAAPVAAQTRASLHASARVVDTRISEAAVESAGRLVRDASHGPDDAVTPRSRATRPRRDNSYAGVFLARGACQGAGDCPGPSVLIIYW